MVLETLVTSPFSSWINLTWDLESSDGGERLTALGHLCVKVNKSCHQTCALTWRICRTAYRHTATSRLDEGGHPEPWSSPWPWISDFPGVGWTVHHFSAPRNCFSSHLCACIPFESTSPGMLLAVLASSWPAAVR